MATHTPGPWKAEESRSHAMGDTVWWITADRAIQGEKIAGMGPISIDDREGCETMAADARLMALAPDLLAFVSHVAGDAAEVCPNHVEEARTLLRRARGAS